jgi:hypothetical protein
MMMKMEVMQLPLRPWMWLEMNLNPVENLPLHLL